jgi:putative transposase
MLARKSIKQTYAPTPQVLSLMQEYRKMTNDAIQIGLANDTSTMKRLSALSYKVLKRCNVPSCYRLCAISKAAGILASRKKSIKRGHPTKDPYLKKPLLVSCYHFKIANGNLRIPVANREYESILLNDHTLKTLEDDKSLVVRSFTLTESSLSLSIAKEVQEVTRMYGAAGIDRNVWNLTAGNVSAVEYISLSRVVDIGETTKGIVRSFKRNDHRIRKQIAAKYGRRKKERVGKVLNKISKYVVENACKNKHVLVFEDITHIRSMYRKGNYQSRDYRRRMNNHWSFSEIKRQIEYKAAWKGVPVIHLTKKETRGTSLECVKCGERLQSPFKNDVQHKRQLWCQTCRRWFDRDLVAVMNISRRGWLRFGQSKGIGSEAMVQEPERTTAILKVDPMKLCRNEEDRSSSTVDYTEPSWPS